MLKHWYILLVVVAFLLIYALRVQWLLNAEPPVYSDDHSAVPQKYDAQSDKPYPQPEPRPWWMWN
jgi:hypothetical protein